MDLPNQVPLQILILSLYTKRYAVDNFDDIGIPDGANKCPPNGGDKFKVCVHWYAL